MTMVRQNKRTRTATFELLVEVVRLHREWQMAKADRQTAERLADAAQRKLDEKHAAEEEAQRRHANRLQAVNLLLEGDRLNQLAIKTMWDEAKVAYENES